MKRSHLKGHYDGFVHFKILTCLQLLHQSKVYKTLANLFDEICIDYDTFQSFLLSKSL